MEDGAPARTDRRRSLKLAGLAGLGPELAPCAPPAAPPSAKPATSNQTGPAINKDAPHPDAAQAHGGLVAIQGGHEEEVAWVSYRLPARPGVQVPDFCKGAEACYAMVEALKLTRHKSALFRESFGIT